MSLTLELLTVTRAFYPEPVTAGMLQQLSLGNVRGQARWLVYTAAQTGTGGVVKQRWEHYKLSQQLALVAAAFCLSVSLALVILAALSSRHMQQAQEADYGEALANQIARRIGTALETGDLLSVAASLQRFVETSSAQEVAIYDVEGKALGQAGRASGATLVDYRAPVLIENDVAGEVVITLSTDNARMARLRFLLSLLGLAILLSLAVYGISHQLGQRLGTRIATLSKRLRLDDSPGSGLPNEMARLEQRVDALPMDLLRARGTSGPRDENYLQTSVLYLHLSSLSNYVDTLDEDSLHRYTNRLHQVVFAAAGFYAGELHVVRQFGLAVYFVGDTGAGSPAFRAASCAWLVGAVSRELERNINLSLNVDMAIGLSELGAGDGADIYPGLYMQSTLDELQQRCQGNTGGVSLLPNVCEDVDVAGRLDFKAIGDGYGAMLTGFEGPYQDLLTRQLRLIMRRLTDPV